MQSGLQKNRSQMIFNHLSRPVSALVLVLGLHAMSVPQSAFAQTTAANKEVSTASVTQSGKKLIGHEVYANWRSIQNAIVSRDGLWAAYALVGQESDGEIVLKNLRDGKEWRAPRGNAPMFSYDGKYVAFSVVPTRAELDKAKKAKLKPEDAPKAGVGVMDLSTGTVEYVERVKRFSFPEEGSGVLAALLEPVKETKKDAKKDDAVKADSDVDSKESMESEIDEDQQMTLAGVGSATKKKEPGTELLVWDLANKQKTSIQDVADMSWNKPGTMLAYSISLKDLPKDTTKDVAKEPSKDQPQEIAKTENNTTNEKAKSATQVEGVYIWSSESKSSKAILTGAGSYKYLRFDDAGQQFAVLSNRDELAKKAKDPQVYSLFYWRADAPQAKLLVNAESNGMTKAWAPSEHADLNFSKDGQRLFLSTAEVAIAPAKNAPEAVKVDLWHWKDPELQSMQKANAERDKQRSYRAVVHLADGKFVQLANKLIPQVMINDNAQFAMGISTLPYRHLMSWDSLHYDAYAVDLQNGQAKMLIEKSRFMPQFSPAGKYLVQFDADKSVWWSYSTTDGKKTNLTGHIKTRFDDQQRDTPEPKNAFGLAGWTADDASVVIYDQFDLWDVNLQSKVARNLTAGFGRKNQLELRYVHLGDARQSPQTKALPADKPWVLSATHDVNQSTGYYTINPTASTTSEPKRLIHADKLFSGLIKAKDSDTILFTQQTFTEFPDLWSADLNFTQPQKISYANPQQAQYNWGTQEMIDYTSADGKKLKALVAKPENFDPKKKYPMMVYIYEKMTDNMHRFVSPAPAQNINVTRYVSNGYIVLRPDIVYKTGYPGKSALDTVVPAVQQVIAKGYVDPKRVGIQGHSWGAYQISYMITRTNIFRAAEAGASMANMISGYGGIRWGAGISRAFQYEKQQSRIGGTPWDSTAKYVENSPIFAIDKVQTPFLTVHNDDDDAVPWYQAIEFFTAMRRLNKEAYWFNYNGEKHGLRDRDNIKHFTVHMSEFFDHYLLNKPRPEWMDKPVPYLEKGKRDVMGQFVPAKDQEQKK